MRSEERAGIISVVMLFLWGTLIAEPFHIFARNISTTVRYAFSALEDASIVRSLILYVVVVSAVILLQMLSKTRFGIFIPCVISTALILILVVKSIARSTVNYHDALCLAIPAVIAIILYMIKSERLLKWLTDVYVYSLGIALINSLLFVPIAKLNGTVGKILYITRYNNLDITSSMSGLAGIPELVWGLFMTAFAVLPIIYLATSSRRK